MHLGPAFLRGFFEGESFGALGVWKKQEAFLFLNAWVGKKG